MDEEVLARVGFYETEGIGSVRLRRLIEAFGSARGAWEAREEEWVDVIGSKRLAEEMDRVRRGLNLERLDKQMVKGGVRVLAREYSRDYPVNLRGIENPPELLFVRGDFDFLERKLIAVVGTRKPTSYGLRAAKKLVMELVGVGYGVVSGLALGIDGAAHRAAVTAGGKTIGILGGGIGQIYPSSHERLAHEMISKGGAVVAESFRSKAVKAGQFAARNRIISGLSLGVLVVEAAAKSGTQITVKAASNQGKVIMAVPGEIGKPMSEGPLKIIAEGGKLVSSVEDVLRHLGEKKKVVSKSFDYENLSEEERVVCKQLAEESRSVDDLVKELEWSVSRVNQVLTVLEIKGLIERVGDKYEVI